MIFFVSVSRLLHSGISPSTQDELLWPPGELHCSAQRFQSYSQPAPTPNLFKRAASQRGPRALGWVNSCRGFLTTAGTNESCLAFIAASNKGHMKWLYYFNIQNLLYLSTTVLYISLFISLPRCDPLTYQNCVQKKEQGKKRTVIPIVKSSSSNFNEEKRFFQDLTQLHSRVQPKAKSNACPYWSVSRLGQGGDSEGWGQGQNTQFISKCRKCLMLSQNWAVSTVWMWLRGHSRPRLEEARDI